jgi:hypothetical protein
MPPQGMPMARKEGGKVYRSYKDMDAGSLGGKGKLEKTEIQERKGRASGGKTEGMKPHHRAYVSELQHEHAEAKRDFPKHAATKLMYGDIDPGDRDKLNHEHAILKDRVNKLHGIASGMGINNVAPAPEHERAALDAHLEDQNYHKMVGHPDAHKAYSLMKAIAEHKGEYKAGGKVYRSYKDMDSGSMGGLGRLEKSEIQEHKH